MTNEEHDTIPAVTGVQPDAPNVEDPERHDLAQGPASTGEEVEAHPVDD